ncbi:MAG: PQQ-dependent sugar dehydrogenase, partial [Rhodanobacter sp.]
MRSLVILLLVLVMAPAFAAGKLDRLVLPPGFHVALFSDQLPNARAMALGARGTVFVGSTGSGKVYALTDSNGDGVADKVRVIVSGLDLPMGVAFHDGDLNVSAVSPILVFRDIEQHLDDPPKPVVVTDKLPGELHHGGKFIRFGPNGKLYVAIGAPCNICDPGPDHGKIIRMNADGSDWQDVARGVRNSVGFDWQPGSGHLWFTDNGRDLPGDDVPSDELNEINHPGEHSGYPYCHQGDVLDPEFGKGKSCSNYPPPVVKLGAHVASL